MLNRHPHTYVAEALRLNVIEHELYYKINSDYMSAWAALSAHANVDLNPAINTFKKLCKDTRNTIPFMQFDSVNKALNDDLQKAIDQFKRMEKEDADGHKST